MQTLEVLQVITGRENMANLRKIIAPNKNDTSVPLQARGAQRVPGS